MISNLCLIMMATFNGEKYIKQQLDSIINQTYTNWILLIRDDGSYDSTKSILNEYEEIDHRIEVIYNDTCSHGAYLNFWTLIHEARDKYSNYDYYFFSDQDDIWEANKLEIMITQAKEIAQDKPILLYGDMRVIDQNNTVVYESLNRVMGIGEMSGYSLFFTHGFLWGCDVCINKKLFSSMPLLPLNHSHIDIMSHDNYMGKYALLTGEIIYIDKVLISHRRHGNNTTGYYLMKLSPQRVLKKAFFQFKDLAKVHARVYNQTLIFINNYSRETENNNSVISQIEEVILNGGVKACATMRRLGVKRQQLPRTVGIYFVMMLKTYKKWIFFD